MSVEVHAVEPLSANCALLESALEGAGFRRVGTGRWRKADGEAAATVVVHRLALGAERRAEALFPALAGGEEVGSVCGDDGCEDAAFEGRYDGSGGPRYESVAVETLDGLLAGLGVADAVDFLALDVEGHDPNVLAGGRKTVAGARFLEFEYHYRGAWAADSLRRHIALLETDGYDCYLEGAHSALWRLSNGCFDAAFEFRDWSNVACVRRDEPAWHAMLQRYAVV